MNDFLQNLRNQSAAKERRFNKPKGNYDNNAAPPHPERRSGQDRRLPRATQQPSTENFQALQIAIEALVETQRDRIFIEDRKVEAEERKAEALERLSDTLERLLDTLMAAPSIPSPAAPEVRTAENMAIQGAQSPEMLDTSEEDIRKTSRKYIVKLIEKLRKDNMTYEQVAAYLTENGFPTFSGRGRWHAQTIHRLCQ